jgi:hypothetical protein
VTVHTDSPVQLMLHDSSQVPLHTFMSEQSSEQLPAPQLLSLNSQVSPLGHAHDEPVHWGAFAASLPHAALARRRAQRTMYVDFMIWILTPPGVAWAVSGGLAGKMPANSEGNIEEPSP